MTKALLRRLFGPGTILAVAFLAIYFVAGQKDRPRPVVTKSSEVVRPLWKPEPEFLLVHAGQLQIQGGQLEHIQALDRAWRAEKERMLRSLEHFQSEVPSDARTEPSLKASLEGYSDLSRTFDGSRRSYWSAAVDLLTQEQLSHLEKLKEDQK